MRNCWMGEKFDWKYIGMISHSHIYDFDKVFGLI